MTQGHVTYIVGGGLYACSRKIQSFNKTAGNQALNSSCFSAEGKEERVNRPPRQVSGRFNLKSGAVAMLIAIHAMCDGEP